MRTRTHALVSGVRFGRTHVGERSNFGSAHLSRQETKIEARVLVVDVMVAASWAQAEHWISEVVAVQAVKVTTWPNFVVEAVAEY